jgi:putative FmdB family regulatory protein
MPLYEYLCEACEHRFEVIRRFSDDPIAICPSCGQGPVVKLLSSPAIQFKGSGWYITDYARKGKDGGEKGEKGEKKDATPAKKDAGTDTASKSSESSAPAPAPAKSND